MFYTKQLSSGNNREAVATKSRNLDSITGSANITNTNVTSALTAPLVEMLKKKK